MIQQLETPVIIIGAGPAGAGTSIFLSKYGIPHIIIEKAIFPRDKVCGDACSGKTLFVLRKANLDWAPEIFSQQNKFLPSHGITFVAPNGKAIEIPFGGPKKPGELTAGFTTTRLIFDNFLFEKIDKNFATVFQQSAIEKIEKKENGITVFFTQNGIDYQVKSKLIIGADGDKSIVQKTLVHSKSSPKAIPILVFYLIIQHF
jgi:2-polyprenyl-6-methoxyphenol hydroxylase-like FAD-dependent oxidoreductase